ncbi:glycosyltransferase [uncultured Thiohalocapsa sp.]|uniref:glycosyltransferase n=1 Tax=uncultured Thiohalocapsa sp. TaxID=768990 RepID=UPI0025DD84BF|nr:glycosyltransferase [uncultured Thiohalocapsa sp.]
MTAGRVLCVTSNFPRWAGDSTTPFVLHLAQDLQALGWQVDVLAPHAPDASQSETLGGVRVERFRYLWPERAQTVCYQGGALINLRKNPLNKLKLPALVGAETLAIARRLRSRRYDILHSHWILPQGFAGRIASAVAPLPHVLTVHGGDIFGLRGRLMGHFKRAALRGADAVTVNSSATGRAVLEIAEKLPRLERIPMGIAVNPPDARQQALAAELRAAHRRGNGPLLLFVGRVVEEKGVEDLLQATRLLRRSHPDVRALIVGEGQDRAAMERIASDIGIADCTSFTGWVAPEDIPAYMRAADAFVGPSRTGRGGWIEAQGLTFLEAMGAGVSVVATRSGGIVDAVIDGDTGLLVDERAPGQIARAIERLVADAPFAAQLSAAAATRVRQQFSREATAARFSDLFSSLLSERQASIRRNSGSTDASLPGQVP